MKFGIERLLTDTALQRELKGKRVALLAHPASVTSDLTHSLDALAAAGLKLTAAFGPQHGLRGDKQDNMVESPDFNDPALGGPGFVSNWVTGEIVKAADYTIAGQVWTQAKAVGVTILWSGVVAFIAYKVVDLVVGLRVSEEDEREGLDIASHGESAYRM